MQATKSADIRGIFVSKIRKCSGGLSHAGCREFPIKSLLILASFFALLLLGVMNAHAQTFYYVRAGAAGSQNGSDWNNAFSSLPATLVRGATYYIADGSYSGYIFNDPTSGTLYITIKKATASDHGTGTGWQSSFGDGQATFSGMIEFTTSYWVFDGVTGGGPENNWNQNFGFKITETGDSNAVIRIGYTGTANYITIRHVDMQGKGSVSTSGGGYSNDGLAIYGASNTTLSYFWMHGIGRCPFFISAQNVIAEYGWVQSYYGSGPVHSEIASMWAFDGGMGDVTFRHNLFTDVQLTGGLMWDNSSNHNAHLYVYGNVFYRPSGATWSNLNGVIGGWTGNSGEDCYGMRIYNNTFININVLIFTNFILRSSDNIVYNNIFYNCNSPDYADIQTHNYNHYINSGGAHSEANGTSATSGDPFLDHINLNFALKAATTAGTALSSPFNVDPDGITRGSDGIWDRGAFEFGGDRGDTLAPPSNVRILSP